MKLPNLGRRLAGDFSAHGLGQAEQLVGGLPADAHLVAVYPLLDGQLGEIYPNQVRDVSGHNNHATVVGGTPRQYRHGMGAAILGNGFACVTPVAYGPNTTILIGHRQTVGNGPNQGSPRYAGSSANLTDPFTGAQNQTAGVTLLSNINIPFADDIGATTLRPVAVAAGSAHPFAGDTQPKIGLGVPDYPPTAWSVTAFSMEGGTDTFRIVNGGGAVEDQSGAAMDLVESAAGTWMFGVWKFQALQVKGDVAFVALYNEAKSLDELAALRFRVFDILEGRGIRPV